jgi:hypothetical protein
VDCAVTDKANRTNAMVPGRTPIPAKARSIVPRESPRNRAAPTTPRARTMRRSAAICSGGSGKPNAPFAMTYPRLQVSARNYRGRLVLVRDRCVGSAGQILDLRP